MAEDAQPNPPEKPPTSFGGLAKKIRSRTTDLLAIAIIAIGGFAVGGKVSQWWETEDGAPQTAPSESGQKFPEDAPVELDFGDSPFGMNRRIIKGDRKSALKQLTAICIRVAETSSPPAQSAGKAEQQLLAALSDEKPVQETGKRRVYLKDGPVPLAVVIERAESSTRVVCWGLVFPSGENRWTAYAFHPASPGRNTGSATAAVIPLPTAARPILTIRGRGNTWRTFRSKQPIAEIKRFYAEWFISHGWTETTSTNGKSGWAAVYVIKTDAGKQRAEIQISRESAGMISGVAFVRQNDE